MGLYATLAVTGTELALDGTEKPCTYYFRGAKLLYKDDAWKTATGITDVTDTHEGEVVLVDIGDLLLHGFVRTAEVEIIDEASKKVLAIKKIRYSGTKSSTIENKTADGGLVGLTWKGVSKSDRLKNKPIRAVIESRKMIVD
ncbi:hypothetical protein PQG02_18780 [Nostoc sp. UHCC 0926]|uniref:hypothetical protein n=1 Tax=Nostoc sp. UHCC 0926 TaxID=3025190 RepID=UPI00235FF68D|nr:hypothetical protein [Nostoc sp. UHCC 0926]WDD30785.1 hypothetical protein PQG02_18780 [Nostoc sp. UHCC 0926]